MAHALHHAFKTWQSLQFCMDSNHLRVVFITTNVCSSLFTSIQVQPNCFSTLLSTSFLSLPSSILHRDAHCQQHHRCLIAAHNLWHFQAPIEELIQQNVLSSPHYHEFCKHQAKPYVRPRVWVLHTSNHAGVMFQIDWNHVICGHWSIAAHAFIYQTCMPTSWQKTDKSAIISLYAFFTHLFGNVKSFLTMPMHGTSSKYGIPKDHISRWHFVEHSPSILHAPTFCIHVNQAMPYKTSESHPLWMVCSWVHLPSSSATILAYTELGSTSSCCICSNSSSAFCLCPHLTCPTIMVFYQNSKATLESRLR